VNTHFTYFLIHLASIAGPLALSFDKKVQFYKKWKYVFPAMILPGLFFLLWDAWFTHQGVWSFSPLHTTGRKLGNLPIEEVLFFITVPYCCLFIYECIRCYFPATHRKSGADWLLGGIAIVLFLMGCFTWEQSYTSYTGILNGLFIAVLFGFKKYFSRFHALSFLIAYAIILIPFLMVNGWLTAIPVVIYNNAENSGIRIFSFLSYPFNNIPAEDIFYGMLLILMNVVCYEKLRSTPSDNISK
jgi:lycopene cyclase domain-containing protein